MFQNKYHLHFKLLLLNEELKLLSNLKLKVKLLVFEKIYLNL